MLGLVLAMVFLPTTHAQTAANPLATATATQASPTPAGQAPDEVLKKLSDLVHAGKNAEAQQTVNALLILYPDDQRLFKAKALIDKLPASAPPANAAPIATAIPTNAPTTQPTAVAASDPLIGMDKVDYNALIELARQAQQNTDLEKQKASLKQFMEQSSPFLQKHPDQMLLWQLRAASAISLNNPMAEYEAGQKLLAAGSADSDDPGLQKLMAELKNKGWLDKQGAEKAQEYVWLRSLQLNLAYGQWSTGHFDVFMKTKLTVTITGLGGMKESVGIRLENRSPKTCRVDGGAMGTLVIRPEDAASGTFTTIRTATRTDWHSYDVPCTVTLSVVDKNGKDVNSATINDGH